MEKSLVIYHPRLILTLSSSPQVSHQIILIQNWVFAQITFTNYLGALRYCPHSNSNVTRTLLEDHLLFESLKKV